MGNARSRELLSTAKQPAKIKIHAVRVQDFSKGRNAQVDLEPEKRLISEHLFGNFAVTRGRVTTSKSTINYFSAVLTFVCT